MQQPLQVQIARVEAGSDDGFQSIQRIVYRMNNSCAHARRIFSSEYGAWQPAKSDLLPAKINECARHLKRPRALQCGPQVTSSETDFTRFSRMVGMIRGPVGEWGSFRPWAISSPSLGGSFTAKRAGACLCSGNCF